MVDTNTLTEKAQCPYCKKEKIRLSLSGHRGQCNECVTATSTRYVRRLDVYSRALYLLKKRDPKHSEELQKWTKKDVKGIYKRCGNKCVINGETDMSKLTLVPYTLEADTIPSNFVLVSKDLAWGWMTKSKFRELITPAIVEKYIIMDKKDPTL